MFKRVFIDANIFIDTNDRNRSEYEKSLALLNYLTLNKIEIYTSCDLITTIYYILSKKDKLNALGGIEKINKICKLIKFSNKEVAQTCKLMRENKKYIDLEDTLQYVLAEKLNCDLIISNDKNFYSDKLELMGSEEFCRKFIK